MVLMVLIVLMVYGVSEHWCIVYGVLVLVVVLSVGVALVDLLE
jgi:hypothetical protein